MCSKIGLTWPVNCTSDFLRALLPARDRFHRTVEALQRPSMERLSTCIAALQRPYSFLILSNAHRLNVSISRSQGCPTTSSHPACGTDRPTVGCRSRDRGHGAHPSLVGVKGGWSSSKVVRGWWLAQASCKDASTDAPVHVS